MLDSGKVALVIVLGLHRSGHLQLATVVRKIGASLELIVQPLLAHVPLNRVDDVNYLVDVLLKLLALLQRGKGYHISLLIGDTIHIIGMALLLRAVALLPPPAARARLATLFAPS